MVDGSSPRSNSDVTSSPLRVVVEPDAAPSGPPEALGAQPAQRPVAAVLPSTSDPAPVADPTVGAFFDVDNTIIRGASIYHLARGLYRREFFTLRDLFGFAVQQARFLVLGESVDHVASIEAQALSYVAGHSVLEMREVGEEVFDELLADRIWPGTLALARMHLDAGQRVWLVTATPVEVAQVIARRLGLTGAIGTIAEHVDGIYTGRLLGKVMHGAVKSEAVAALAELEGLDLARCSAYSDSINDVPLLELVGNPCAINPDRRLRRHARRCGWRVRDYRTGRKAVRAGIPAAAALGALLGAATALLAVRRWWKRG